MIETILKILTAFVMAAISRTGYLGILAMMAIESACIPLPSEIIMPFSGALTVPGIAASYGREPFNLLWVATMGALGCNVGSLVAYEIGCYGGRPLVERYGKYILLSKREMAWAERFFVRYGDATVFFSRLLPVIRTFIALPAGLARMPRLRFHVYTFVGSWPWCLGLAWVGMKLGEKWNSDPRLRMWFHRMDAVIGGLIVLGVIWFLWSRWQHRMKTA